MQGMTVYNSPAALYSQETLAEEADSPSYSQATHLPPKSPSLGESATHKASALCTKW